MLSIFADALMTATRTKTRHRPNRDWNAPDHWRRTEGLGPRDGSAQHREDHRLLHWYEITGPR